MVKVFLNGCCGRMGRAIACLCKDSDEYTIVAGCDMMPGEDMSFPVYKGPNESTEDFDVIIDFSNAKAVPSILAFAIEKKKPFICCTTALDEATLAQIDKASEQIAVFRSANMSLGINIMLELIKKAAATLYPDYDIEILEAHHNRKLDAPSGTAVMLADAVKETVPDEMELIYDRHSVNEARKPNQIGMSSIRGGNIVGEHSIYFISDEETVTISHSAKTRDVFAKGALKAASFMKGKEKGYFNMSDVIAANNEQ